MTYVVVLIMPPIDRPLGIVAGDTAWRCLSAKAV